MTQFPLNAADPGPSDGQFPTNPFLVDRPTVNRARLDQMFPPGTITRNTGDVFLDNPDRILPAQHQTSVHSWNRSMRHRSQRRADGPAARRHSGGGENGITIENDGGRNGAYGPGFVQIDLRSGYRIRMGQNRTVDLFAEVFNLTNRANFDNPSGDLRSGNFLVPTGLRGGGFPRQLQLGARLGF